MHQNCEVISYTKGTPLQTNLLLIDESGAHDLVNEIGKSFPMNEDWDTHCRQVSQGQVMLFEIISAAQAARSPIDLSEVPALIRDFGQILSLSEDAGRKEETRLWCTLTELLRSTDEGMFYDADEFLESYEPLAASIEIYLGLPSTHPGPSERLTVRTPFSPTAPEQAKTTPPDATMAIAQSLAAMLERLVFVTHSCSQDDAVEKVRGESIALLHEIRKQIPLP